jgi:hypothetical protein
MLGCTVSSRTRTTTLAFRRTSKELGPVRPAFSRHLPGLDEESPQAPEEVGLGASWKGPRAADTRSRQRSPPLA